MSMVNLQTLERKCQPAHCTTTAWSQQHGLNCHEHHKIKAIQKTRLSNKNAPDMKKPQITLTP